MAEVSKNPEDWAPIVERIVFQVFYRQLGMVALRSGISVISQTIDMLCKEKGYGSWKWLLEGRLLLWEDIPINNAAKVHTYVFGGKTRDKNTTFIRQGWWRMYMVETTLRTFDKTIIGRILAKI